MGLWIINTLWAGIPQMLKGCETVTLLPTHSPEKYAKALQKIFVEKISKANFAKYARAFYQANFTPIASSDV